MIANRYRIEGEIGKGGMGTVYKGVDTQTGQTVAIKKLKPDISDNDLIERFKREGEALRELNHPNIVKMLAMVEAQGNHYLIMEYLAGGDLSGLLKQGRLPIEKVLHITIDICDALTRAHRLNIIHRDLKPANILLADDGTARLSDFGIAYFSENIQLVQDDSIVGTAEYLAPEILAGSQAGKHSDVWSLGVVLFEMLTNKHPFAARTSVSVLYAITMQPVPDIETLNPDVPIALVDLTYRLLEKDPFTRIASVRHVGAALEDILYGRLPVRQLSFYESRFATPSATYWRRKHNLPTQTTPFIGRETESANLLTLLAKPEVRLISLVAAGGMGKSRLALALGEKLMDETAPDTLQSLAFADGVYFVELAAVTDLNSMIVAVAAATSYPFQPNNLTPQQQLLNFLSHKNMLLILDNYEHLLNTASIITKILKAAPHIKILVTSRQRLQLTGETVFYLQGMDIAQWQTTDDALEYAAAKLFIQSAKHVKPDFELHISNLEAVARICQLVDGLPLGIVLAASWLALLTPAEVAAEIVTGIDFLETDLSDVSERHRSIRVVFDYSWNLMTDTEQQVFMKLSVFRGGFTREAAETVAGANLRTLINLVSKSRIRRDILSGRYDIHELLRQYAAEQLDKVPMQQTVHDAHMINYTNFVAEHELDIKGRNQLVGLQAVEHDFANIRLAWNRATEQRNYPLLNQMLEGLKLYCEMRNQYVERFRLFVATRQQLFPIDEIEPSLLWCRMMVRHAGFLQHQGDVRSQFEKCLEMAKQREDAHEVAYCLYALADAHVSVQDAPKAIELYNASLHAYQSLDDKFYITQILNRLGALHLFLDKVDIAAQYGMQSITYGRQIGDKIDVGWALHTVAAFYMYSAQTGQAAIYFKEAEQIWRENGNKEGLATALLNIAVDCLTLSDVGLARQLAEEAYSLAQDIQNPMRMGCALAALSQVASFEGNYALALHQAEEAMPLLERMPPLKLLNLMALIMATLGLHDYPKARATIAQMIRFTRATNLHYLPATIVFTALLRFGENKIDEATRFLGLGLEQGYLGQIPVWSPLQQLPDTLRNRLGDEAYYIAYEQGKSLNLDTVATQLLIEFGDVQT